MRCRADLKGDVLASKTDLEFLFSVLILRRPFGVVFPIRVLAILWLRGTLGGASYFRISLCLMMRLISSMTMELTHTALGQSDDHQASRDSKSYSLSESSYRSYSSSCLHIAQ